MTTPQSLEEQVRTGWNISAQGYSQFVSDEFQDGTAELWRAELQRALSPITHTPNHTLRVLDVGTGPGMFAILLAQDNWHVTAIDTSPKMLEQAQRQAHIHQVQFNTHTMQAHALDFAAESFDAIVSRNVIWTVADPAAAYAEFFRVLKPAGRVLVYDGDHLADLRQAKDSQNQTQETPHKTYFKQCDKQDLSFNPEAYDQARGWRTQLPLAQHPRPQWDTDTLQSIGFGAVSVHYVDAALSPRSKTQNDAAYKPAKLFVVSADKPSTAI